MNKLLVRLVVPVTAAVSAFAGAAIALAVVHLQHPDSQLLQVCQQVPCTNSQEFEVFDHAANPIFSVGETGGAGVFGDNISVFPPRSVFNAAVTISYASPFAYDAQFHHRDTCHAPHTWYAPDGIYVCTANGTWVRQISL